MRAVVLTMLVVLAATACSDQPFESAMPLEATTPATGTTDATTSSTEAPPETTTSLAISTTEPPASLPLVDNPIAPALPEGVGVDELPEDPGERLDLLTDWLEDNYEDRSSGHSFYGFDGSYSLKLNINEADGLYARALCPFYVELAGLYMQGTEHTVALYGWVRNDSGRYVDADWGTIDC